MKLHQDLKKKNGKDLSSTCDVWELKVQVKEEHGPAGPRVKEPSSPADLDAETAFGMSYVVE